MILAVGQAADLDLARPASSSSAARGGVQVDRRRCAPRTRRSGPAATSRTGPRNLIDAIADGQRAAASIHAALTAQRAPAATTFASSCACDRASAACRHGYDAIAAPTDPGNTDRPARRLRRGRDRATTPRTPGSKRSRCLRCFDNVMLDPELCILCGLCVDVCPPELHHDRAQPIASGSAPSRRACCCSTRTCASAAASA